MSLDSVFRNYDIRGEFGTQLTSEMAERIAKAYSVFAKPSKVAVGMDMRASSLEIKVSNIFIA